jgi:hypothetical protein
MSEVQTLPSSSEEHQDQSRVVYELALERALDRHLDQVVQLAEDRIATITWSDNKLQPSQFRNAANVTQRTDASFRVLKNWLHYQVGRKDSGWSANFADGVIIDCEGKLAQIAGQAVDEAIKASSENSKLQAGEVPARADELGPTHIRLIRLYLGYLIRAFTYASWQNEQQRNSNQPRPNRGR